MKEFRLRQIGCAVVAAIAICGCTAADDPEMASAEATANDWVTLFNGENLDGWHTYNKDTTSPAWIVEDGAIVLNTDNSNDERIGGDLITDKQYENFELELEWKISKGGNSGIFFGVREIEGMTDGYETGLEMQVLDNAEHSDGQVPLTSAGACYGLYPPSENVVRPVGEYNQVRLVVDQGKVEHWLNGVMVTAYDMNSADWAERIENSKFKDWEHFAKYRKGHIGLQDHTDRVSFRNIRIRVL